ncbi:asparagine synthase-related protein [Metabacillus elymi]|uniref:asparagine synthase (glutamine-hydrolyzing) n=1 Tax=Metabacillus elymi TaxID=2745198 RepID=A0ABX6RXI8_9BACI|nr:asparagine synthase-related protein [Metabacillus sp. KUDC1714]QNF26182.1 asparagine synthetase B [Metabacillus sp. KUDC1714]
MSAIAGIINFSNEPIPYEYCRNIMKSLERYPADDVQLLQKENVFLGCHSQWITPESVGEKLPYFDAERRLAITADAIIDNRDDLFERLQVPLEKRKTIKDSELILLSYHKWGEKSPKYLLGDFAYIIWDERSRKIFGARDFSGNRTLYYHQNGQQFLFCTVMNPLLSVPCIKKQLNEQWLAEFISNPGMHESVDIFSSVYQEIKQVPPSHSISITNNNIVFNRYITLTTEGEKQKFKTNEEYETAFREVFKQSVSCRLRTQHKVGAHLSGGLDSGSVVSFAAKSLEKENKKLHTFSYIPLEGFIDWTPKSRVADETPFIKSTVNYVGNINDQYYRFEGKSAFSDIDEWLNILEMPYKFFENSYWMKGMYEIAQEQGIGILLNGKRGNYTISWGPALDYQSALLKKLKWIKLYKELDKYSKNRGIKKSRLFSIITKKAFPVLRNKDIFYSIPSFINPSFAKRTNVFERLKDHGVDTDGSSVSDAYEGRRKQFDQLFFWGLTGTNSTKLSLQYSLIERDPTNDLRVIKFCLGVPENQYVQNGLDRALIRRSTMGYLPDNVRLNQRKRGVQGADGIQRMAHDWGLFTKELEFCLKDPVLTEFVNSDVIQEALSNIRLNPKPELIFHEDFKILMRTIILYRFLKKQ